MIRSPLKSSWGVRRASAAIGVQSGFSLIEALVSIAILGVIMSGMFAFLWGASRHWQAGQDAADLTENARIGLNRVTRELKQSSGVVSFQPDRVSFLVNFGDGDGEETITLGLSSESRTVWRESSLSPGQQITLINHVDGLVFSYFGNDYHCDGDGDGVITEPELVNCGGVTAEKIARVDIALTLNAGTGQQLFTDQAWLRNRTL